MQELRVENESDDRSVGILEVPDDWSVVVGEGPRAMATPPADRFVADGFLPGILVRIEDADADESAPDGVSVLSDHLELTATGVRRTRCTLMSMMDESVMEMVTTVRTADGLLSVVCTGLETQWGRLADTYDRSSATARIDTSPTAEERT